MSDRPLLRVVKGDPTPEELAALIAVLLSRATTTDDTSSPRSHSDLAFGLRRPYRVGPGAWVASGWVAGTRTKAAL
jgi:hypothetical protein